MNEQEAKLFIEELNLIQESGVPFPCPRCGHDRMKEPMAHNAISRHADILICSECGTDEAMRVAFDSPLPFTEWSVIKGHENGEEN